MNISVEKNKIYIASTDPKECFDLGVISQQLTTNKCENVSGPWGQGKQLTITMQENK